MRSVFLDANIFFAAATSSSGGSFYVIELAKRKRLKVITVAHALAEAERNILKKLGEEALAKHYENILAIRPAIQSLFKTPYSLEKKLSDYLPEKDLPILLGVILSGAEILITLDRKHFLSNTKLQKIPQSIKILTPGDFISQYFNEF